MYKLTYAHHYPENFFTPQQPCSTPPYSPSFSPSSSFSPPPPQSYNSHPTARAAPPNSTAAATARSNTPPKTNTPGATRNFCKEKIQRDGTYIREDMPVTFTYNLTAVDGSKVLWVFRNAAVDHVKAQRQSIRTDTAECLERFGQILDSDVIGGLGHSYCVVDGTGGDAFADQKDPKGQSGQGQVMVWGGLVETGSCTSFGGCGGSLWGQWEWEARPKKGS